MLHSRSILRRAAKWPLAALLLTFPHAAFAQTWLRGGTTPALRDLVSVDATGEANWIFGSEDVAGDGLQTFGAAERALDVRSVYADVQGPRLALRAYVSGAVTPEDLRLYAFVDVDRDAQSGGSAAAPEIDAALGMAGAETGYELVIGVIQELGAANVWRWDDANDSFEPIEDLDEVELVIEAGTDRDPLDIGAAPNGYLQAILDPRPLGISATCAVDFLFRATDGLEGGDGDVGERGPCRPVDADADGVADIAETMSSCDADEQCPAGGSCVEGSCRSPELVLGAGEVVRGGAFACSWGPRRDESHALGWLTSAAALCFALARRTRRRRMTRDGER